MAVENIYLADEYDAATTYEVDQFVYYNTTGLFYKCILESTGNLPSNATYFTADLEANARPWIGKIIAAKEISAANRVVVMQTIQAKINEIIDAILLEDIVEVENTTDGLSGSDDKVPTSAAVIEAIRRASSFN